MSAPAVTAPASTAPAPTEAAEPRADARPVHPIDIFAFTFSSGMLVTGMIVLVVSIFALIALAVAGFPLEWGTIAVGFSFLLILTGLFLSWHYRSILEPKKPVTAQKIPGYYPPSYPMSNYSPYPYGGDSGYSQVPYPQATPQYAPGYNPYAYPQSTYGPPPSAPAPPQGPTGPSKACTACGRAGPARANFCPFCRQRL